MRILYIDIDSLRPDHLGCYGYHRQTTPNLDALADEAVRFTNCYVSDAPCGPSRTALWRGQFGARTGVVGHGGTAAQPFIEGEQRGFNNLFGRNGWMQALRNIGIHTATISSFADRHSMWHWYAGFNEIHNVGMHGHERAHHVNAIALEWLKRKGTQDNWFLHVNYWDPHTPYRTPVEYGNLFADTPLPAWLTEEVRQQSWDGYGPHSPQELHGFGDSPFPPEKYPRSPAQLDTFDRVRDWIDGYDVGIRYMDDHVGQLFDWLREHGLWEETAIIVSADHGENQGELNTWGDHQTADQHTCNVPLLLRWPSVTTESRVDDGLHYHFDWAATVIELAGGQVPEDWDGQSFAAALRSQTITPRPYLILSQQAWTCQRAVRFDDYIAIRTYHNGYKDLPPLALYDVVNDLHEQHNLAAKQPDLIERGMSLLTEWQAATVQGNDDPMQNVLREGGPFHVRGELPSYLKRLEVTGRAHHAATLRQ